MYAGGAGNEVGRVRSKSVADPSRMTRDGKPIMHYGTYRRLFTGSDFC
jgi:hypothetical protein